MRSVCEFARRRSAVSAPDAQTRQYGEDLKGFFQRKARRSAALDIFTIAPQRRAIHPSDANDGAAMSAAHPH